jgi:hypothetical protein
MLSRARLALDEREKVHSVDSPYFVPAPRGNNNPDDFLVELHLAILP